MTHPISALPYRLALPRIASFNRSARLLLALAMPIATTMAITMALALASTAAYANDSAFADDNGTIVLQQQDSISMDKEVLEISQERIEVNYVFTNTSSADLRVPIAFPMPPMYFGIQDHSELTDFKIWVNGKVIKPNRSLVILLGDGRKGVQENITNKVKKLGWTEDELAQLLANQDPPKDKPALPKNWFDSDGQARFTMNEYFTWTQNFPAGKSLAIRHSYKPSAETGIPLPLPYLFADYATSTCLDESGKAAIRKRAGKDDGEYAYASVRYVLMTGNNWKGSIKDFTLRIKKSHPSEVISLCLDGDLKKVDPLTFEFHQTDYHPKNDLNILFVRKRTEE